MMTFTRYGNIGDVWKHLALCSILSQERPRYYVETNSSRALHDLEGTPEQRSGVFALNEHSSLSPEVEGSVYLELLRGHNSQDGLTTYPGSPALAMSILADISEKFLFFDLEEEALESVRAYARDLGIAGKTETIRGDSLAGSLDSMEGWGPDHLVFFDPYRAFEPGDIGLSYFDAFREIASKGARCVLWYGYDDWPERAAIARRLREIDVGACSRRLHCVEVFLGAGTQEREPDGHTLTGCGMLSASLSDESRLAVESAAVGLTAVYGEDGLEMEVVAGTPGSMGEEP